MTFPSNGMPFGDTPVVLLALVMVVLITVFALGAAAYLIFFYEPQPPTEASTGAKPEPEDGHGQ